jgi:hypothetical protein
MDINTKESTTILRLSNSSALEGEGAAGSARGDEAGGRTGAEMGNRIGICCLEPKPSSPPPPSPPSPVFVETKPSSPPPPSSPSPVFVETKPSSPPPVFVETMSVMTIQCEALTTAVSPKKGLVLSRHIGTGGFGEVHECYLDGVYCVRKILHKKTVAAENEFNNECEILKSLNHRNIVKVVQATRTSDGRYKELFMEHGGATLFDLVERGVSLDRNMICKQMIEAVAYIHSMCVYHRDIKLENITLDERGLIRFVDFGLCERKQNRREPMWGICGSLSYIAPEIEGGRLYFGEEVDSWSLGVCLFAVFFEFFPFKCADMRDWRFERTTRYQNITRGSNGTVTNILSFYNKTFSRPSEEWEALIDGMICIDPNRRLIARNAISNAHPE